MSTISPMGLLEREPQLQTLRETLATAALGQGRLVLVGGEAGIGKFLGRRIRRAKGLLALTYRDDEVGAGHPLRIALGDLPTSAVVHLSLPPLSESPVAALARRAQPAARAAGRHP